MLLMLQAEQALGAVPALLLVKVQAASSEKAAVNEMAVPSALIITPVKVCGLLRPATERDPMPSPLRSSVPVAGGFTKVTVTSAVKVSSLGSRVPLLLQAAECVMEVEFYTTLNTISGIIKTVFFL